MRVRSSIQAARARRRLRYFLLIAVAAVTLTGSAVPTHAAATAVLSKDVVHHLNAATSLGPVPDSQQITVGVVLSNPNEAAENAFLASLYDPSSSTYQQFLDSDEFNLRFGVSDPNFQAAQTWLSNGGLQVTTIPGAKNYVLATGTAAQVGRLFQTPLGLFSAGGRSFYANTQAPAVPAALPVQTVLGLNNLNRFTNPRVSGPVGPAQISTGQVGDVPVTGLLSPQALWSIYDMPSTNLGNGQTMGIFGWGVTPDTVSHLRSFEQEFRLPQVPVSIRYFGATSTPDTNDGADIEWDLDTQASTGMAPNVTAETLYFAHHNTDADVLASWVGWVNDKKGPQQASASYGECENIPQAEPVIGTDGLEVPGNAVLKQAVIQGRTLFASTGDTGSSCPVIPAGTNGVATQAYPALNYPAGSPYAVAVGGTDLNSDGGNPAQRLTETAWEFTGGGNSVVAPAGGYQASVAPTKCVEDMDGNPLLLSAPPCRGIPDVAAISGDVATGNGMTITDSNGTDQQGAGTSLSSPLWLGMWTRVQAAAAKKGLGFANFPVYKTAQSAKYANDFFDVTVGNNQPYPALPGWDNVSGWGVPDVGHLMKDLTGRLTPVKNTTPALVAATPTTSCGDLFADPSGDDVFVYQGQSFGAQGAQPQLDILSGKALLSPDGTTLRTIITVRDLSTVIPTGGGENTFNFIWTLNGLQFFTQLAIEPGDVVAAYDGEVIHLPVLTKYQQLHVDAGVLTQGPNGTIEVDVPLANIGSPSLSQVLQGPTATANVRMVLPVGGLFSTIDSAGPTSDYVVAGC